MGLRRRKSQKSPPRHQRRKSRRHVNYRIRRPLRFLPRNHRSPVPPGRQGRTKPRGNPRRPLLCDCALSILKRHRPEFFRAEIGPEHSSQTLPIKFKSPEARAVKRETEEGIGGCESYHPIRGSLLFSMVWPRELSARRRCNGRRGRRWKKCHRDSRANDQVSSSVALTPQGKGFASDETRFPAYETRLKQSACIVVLGSVLTKSLPGHSPKPLPWAWTS